MSIDKFRGIHYNEIRNPKEAFDVKTCPNCQAALGDTDRFCHVCGAAVEPAAPEQNTAAQQGAPVYGSAPQGGYQAPVKYCEHCGNPCDIHAAVCLKCGCAFAPQKAIKPDVPSMWLRVACFFIPVLGLVLYLVERDEHPISAKAYGMAALISVIVYIVCIILWVIFMFVLVGIGATSGIMYYASML